MKPSLFVGLLVILVGPLIWNPLTGSFEDSSFQVIVSGVITGLGIAITMISLMLS